MTISLEPVRNGIFVTSLVEPEELLVGLKKEFSVYFTPQEKDCLIKYIDDDGSGDISF
jgi:hypothetical protein